MVLQRLLSVRFKQVKLFSTKIFQPSASTEMQNAYICYADGAEKFSLTFHYVNDKLGVNRQFNLNRQLSEPVSAFLSRIQCNVEKIVNEVHAKRRRKSMKKKEQGEDHDPGPAPQVTVELLRGGNPVSSEETCQSILQSKDLLMLSLSGKKYHIVTNPPWVEEIQLPKSILSNFPVYPSKFVGNNLDRSESTFLWYKQPKNLPINSDQWKEVGSGYTYTPSVNDIDHVLKVCWLKSQGHLL